MSANPLVVTPTPDVAATGPHFTVTHLGALETLDRFEIRHPRLKKPGKGKVFLRDVLGLTGTEVSLNRFPAGATLPFSHKHQKNEELFIFIRGKGELLIDGRVIPVSEGSLVRIAPEGVRTLRSTGGEDLYYICIQAKAGSIDGSTGADGVAVEDPPAWPS